MAAGSVFAGLADGFARGYGLSRQFARDEEDRKDREEERKDRAAMRERLRRQQADDDAVTEALRGVKRDVSSYGPSPEDSDMYGPLAGDLRQVPRSQRDILADQARAVAGVGGLRGAQLGLQFQQGVDSLDELQRQRRRDDAADARQRRIDDETATDVAARRAREAITDRQARVVDGLRTARAMLGFAGDDPKQLAGVVNAMSAIYEGVPDGRKLVMTPDGKMGLVGPDAKFLYPPVPVNRKNIEDALAYGERYLDPNWAAREQRDTERSYRGTLANIAQRELDAKIGGGYFNQRPAGTGGESVRTITDPNDGTVTILGRNGQPSHNILSGGVQVGLGLTNSAWQKAQRDAASAGVRAAIGKDARGQDRIAFIGADGKPYDSVAEAARARPAAAGR